MVLRLIDRPEFLLNWINKVLDSTAESEAPEVFYYWSALAVLSAVLGKDVYLDRYYYKLYPNIYVLTIARSGLRKGNPVILAKALLEEVNTTRVISGRNSIQAAITDLGKAYSLEGGGVVKNAQGILISGEFAAFLLRDPDAFTILTDLYDTHAHEREWKNTLKHSGTDKLREPCICLFGATNDVHFQEALPNDAIGGGFVARTFLVHADKKRNINPLMDAPRLVPNVEDLSTYLKEVAKLKGAFQMSQKAKTAYSEWYHEFSKLEHAKDTTGTMERVHDQILKVAMLISLSDSPELVIKTAHLLEATEKCMDCASSVKRITMGIGGKAPLASQTATVLKELLSHPEGVGRVKLLQRNCWEFDAIDLDRIVETLLQSKAIEIKGKGAGIVYKISKSTLETYTKYQKEMR